jgi:O-antigen/teichoic acid export membrane protein
MREQTVYKMVFDIFKIMLFCVSCTVFTIPFLFLEGKLCLNVPVNGSILLILFVITALFESFDRLVGDFRSHEKRKKVGSIVEVYVLFALVIGAMIFILVGDFYAISVTVVICSSMYFMIKLLRMGRIINDYLFRV